MRYAHLSEVALVPFFRRFLWRKNGTRRLLPPSIEAKCLSNLKIKQANEAAYLGRPLCDCASLKHLSPEVSQPWDTLGSRHWTKYQSNSVITISTIETHRESIQKAIFVVLLSCTFSKQTDFWAYFSIIGRSLFASSPAQRQPRQNPDQDKGNSHREATHCQGPHTKPWANGANELDVLNWEPIKNNLYSPLIHPDLNGNHTWISRTLWSKLFIVI